MDGYTTPTPKFHVNYNYIKNRANKSGNKVTSGVDPILENLYLDLHPYLYESNIRPVKIKHVFQDLYDKSKYGGLTPNSDPIEKKQYGEAGQNMNVSPLPSEDRIGFKPEASVISTRVPENLENFFIEYRYNREKYNVVYDTAGGTSIPARTLYYGQTIPEVKEPTKKGATFLGWSINHDISYTDESGTKKEISAGTLIANKASQFKEAMPATNLVFKAHWKEDPKADYTILYYAEKADHKFGKDNPKNLREKYDFVGARIIKDAATGSEPNLKDQLPIGIYFPDLGNPANPKEKADMEAILNDTNRLKRYYTFNENLTKSHNEVREDRGDGTWERVQKKVDSSGNTVYEVYYDRAVYTLLFEKVSRSNSFDPEITVRNIKTGNETIYDYARENNPTEPYTIKARFGEFLGDKWVRDGDFGEDYLKNIFKGEEFAYISKGYKPKQYSLGWMLNLKGGSKYRDVPPYRLSRKDFIDVTTSGGRTNHSHSRKGADGKPIPYGDDIVSLGISQGSSFVAHHVEFYLEGLDGKAHYHPELYYWKSDTSNRSYKDFHSPQLKGFTPISETHGWTPVTKDELANLNKGRPEDEKVPFPFQPELNEKKTVVDGKIVNGHIVFDYTRNAYKLFLNSDPTKVEEDAYYEGKTFQNGAAMSRSLKFEQPLADLDLPILSEDVKDNDMPDSIKALVKAGSKIEFKGWAMDPAGVNMIQKTVRDDKGHITGFKKDPDAKETMPDYNLTIYAIWGEEEPDWTLKVDPNGGTLRKLSKDDFDLKAKNKDDSIDDIFKTLPKENIGDVQAFSIKHRTKINSILTPKRKGYDFLGWELVRFDDKGKEDRKYFDTYKVPELYAFGNDVVTNVYLRAIWVENRLVDMKAYHHFFDSEGNELKEKMQTQNLVNRRIGSYVSAVATEQGAEWTLMTEEDLENVESYQKYKNEAKEGDSKVNKFYQVMRVDDPKIEDPNNKGEFIDNPDAHNEFHFYYRAWRTRKYKVNYFDNRIEKIEKPTEKDIKKYRIIPQEKVENGNKHYDARNFRSIPGWKLTSKPQQQLFFDLDDNGDFLGINGGNDEISFYYKDIRVIEREKESAVTPDGYVRVIFKIDDKDKGGSFGTNPDGTPKTEIVYDVIEGLMSDNLLVPQELKDGQTQEEGKYYIKPDPGKKFIKWDNQKLLNENTVLRKGGKYTFTAYFDWSDIIIRNLVKTESYKDDKGNYINNFVPTEDELKAAVKRNNNGIGTDLPKGVSVTIDDDANTIYEKVKELGKSDKDELIRTVMIKATVDFGNSSKRNIEIPVKIYKNVYEALTSGDKPKVLADGEKEDLKDITGNYIKVTVNPTGRPKEKDSKIYYVNKNAWVNIPEIKFANGESLGFTNWTADKEAQNEKGVFDFEKRHKFTKKDTVISPGFAQDNVTLTYDANGGTGDVPEDESTKNGGSVRLANQGNLKKENYNFIGWKIGKDKNNLGTDIYQPGASITLNENMIAVAQWSNKQANVSYKFLSADPNRTLPQEVLDKLPQAETKNVGYTVSPSKNTFDNVVIAAGNNQGTWTFKKWDKDNLVVSGTKENIFTGTWELQSKERVNVIYNSYKYENATPSEDVKSQIEGIKKPTYSVYKGSTVKTPENITETFTDTIDGKVGVWIFKEWKTENNLVNVQEDVYFTGVWTFTENDMVNINYVYNYENGTPSPMVQTQIEAANLKPEDTKVYTGTRVNAPEFIKEVFEDRINGQKGEWRFWYWTPNTDQVALGSGITFYGTWIFIEKGQEPPIYPNPEQRPQEPIFIEKPIIHTEIVEKIVEKEVYRTNEIRRQVRYMQGFQNNFRPKDALTRAEAAQILANALVEDKYKYNKNYKISYTDVKEKDWFAQAVRITSQAGVFKGYDDGEFKPQNKITRAEWVSTLKRFQMLQDASGNQMNLRENHWAIAEVQAAFNEGWLEIYTDNRAKFNEDEPITRAEVAAVSNKAFGRLIDKEYIMANKDNLINYKDIDPSMWAYIDILNASNTFLHKERNYKAYKINENSYNIDTSIFNISQDAFQRNIR